MAHRDLSQYFLTRRSECQQRKNQHKAKLYPTTLYIPDILKQQNNSALERQLLGDDGNHKRSKNSNISSEPSWLRYMHEANESIRLLEMKLEYLDILHTRRLMIPFNESEETYDQEIGVLTHDITKLFQQADKSIQFITRVSRSTKSRVNAIVQKNSQSALACRLQVISHHFRHNQCEYIERLKVQQSVSNTFDSNISKEVTSSQQYDSMISVQDHYIESRHNEIQEIAKSIGIIAMVFKEVATMVIDQGTMFDRIDYNMSIVAKKMQTGLLELQKAEEYQRNTRPERCMLLLTLMISICIYLLILKHM